MPTVNCVDNDICCGCNSCADICPKNCISMNFQGGFRYPVIDEDKCTNCGLCFKICPVSSEIKRSIPNRAVACYSNIKSDLLNSSSGGVFKHIAEAFIKKGGIVWGVAFNTEFDEVHHISVESIDDLSKICTSKYIQTNDLGVYKKIRKQINSGRNPILFSGTPCQCAALKKYLGANFDKVFYVDFKCHGVPSPLLWKKYVETLKHKYGSNVQAVNFRNKDRNWREYNLRVDFENGKIYRKHKMADPFLRFFLKDFSLRISCFSCKFRGEERVSDLTISDYWNVANELPEMDNVMGTSYCTINTEKGSLIWKHVSKKLYCKDAELSQIMVKHDPPRKIDGPLLDELLKAVDVSQEMKRISRDSNKEKARHLYIKIRYFRSTIRDFIEILKMIQKK